MSSIESKEQDGHESIDLLYGFQGTRYVTRSHSMRPKHSYLVHSNRPRITPVATKVHMILRWFAWMRDDRELV